MIKKFGSENSTDSNIQALIFISDQVIKSEENYTNPKIMARSLTTYNEQFLTYKGNIKVNHTHNGSGGGNKTNNTSNGTSSSIVNGTNETGNGTNEGDLVADFGNFTMPVLLEGKEDPPKEPVYWAEVSHTFISRCYLLSDLYPIFYICSIIFLAVTVVWSVFVFIIRKNTSHSF